MRFLAIIFSLFLFLSCETKQNKDCNNLICTDVFGSVSIKFTDSIGNPIIVKDFKSINLRTNKEIASSGQTDTNNAKDYYIVVSDLNILELSNTGDTLLVSAKSPKTPVVKQGKFVVSGGKCECHIIKLSGPEVISF